MFGACKWRNGIEGFSGYWTIVWVDWVMFGFRLTEQGSAVASALQWFGWQQVRNACIYF